ncbi:hypothetical protein C3B44_03450 [Corynebacterium yudongzhengii]|uniref:RDD domain-containing protein n=1 Tax=Corynebacterium yudongzhengii TaxID=2080740 RepID=A0A2U1T7E7_9CORY|nr:RDD family protein [Corynebacterium yudongzhengii]AWB81526.1 hypothetical protein C3B44_03450 [Corynebacterium yudongzhengii]PWC01903.1 hypothetical protein DF222_04795 [Corynebacterium yudongzhengii]
MAESRRSWLDGPHIPSEYDGPDDLSKWPGEKLGLPKRGPGSMASVARRAAAVIIDWIACMIVAGFINAFITDALGDTPTLTLLLWLVVGIIGGWLFARTPGMAVLGLGVARVDVPGARVGLWRAVVRTVLTAFILPAAMVDADGRGMHDRGTGTVVIRS